MNWLSATFGWLAKLFGLNTSVDPARVLLIQAAAVKACGFLPMAESIAAIVAAGNPAVLTVSAIVHQLCSIVKSTPEIHPIMGLASLTDEEPPPTWGTLNGVPVQGMFIR